MQSYCNAIYEEYEKKYILLQYTEQECAAIASIIDDDKRNIIYSLSMSYIFSSIEFSFKWGLIFILINPH